MPFRTIKSKTKKEKETNKGIYEYFRKSEPREIQSYYYSYTNEHGKSARVKAAANALPEVRAERDSKVREIKSLLGGDFGARDCTLNELLEVYLDARTKKSNLLKDRQKYNNHIKPLIGSKLVSKVGVAEVQSLDKVFDEKKLSPATKANILIILKAMLNYAEAIDMQTMKPFSKKTGSSVVIKVKKNRGERVRVLNKHEMEQVFNAAKIKDERLYFMFKMLYHTLQRPQSILELKCGDIDLVSNKISLGTIKGQAARYIPISKKLKPLLMEWMHEKEKYQRLIELSYSRLSSIANTVFSPLNDKLYSVDGLNDEDAAAEKIKAFKEYRHEWVSMYSFRHTSATNLYSATSDIKLVKELLGHSDFKMTEIYAKLNDKQKQDGIDAL